MQRLPSTWSVDTELGASSASPVPLNAREAEADVRLYYIFIEEVLQRGAIGAAEEFLATDFVAHGAAGDRHRHEFVTGLATRRARFPDAVWTIELLAGVGGLVVCHTTIVASDPPKQGWESVVIRFAAGKMAEYWRICDDGLLTAERYAPS